MKKLKFLLATLVFLTLVLACGQVNATVTTAFELGAFLNDGGGQVEIQGQKVILHHDVSVTTDLYIYQEKPQDMTIDLNGYNLDFNFASDPGVTAIWANNAGALTITDSSNNADNFIRVNKKGLFSWNTSKGELTVENVNIYTTYACTEPVFGNSGMSTTNLKNSKITTYNYVTGGQNNTNYNFENVTIDLAGNYEYAIKLGSENELTLKNCNFKSSNNSASGRFLSIESDKAKATIDGGKYSYEGTNSSDYLLLNNGGTLEIKDGEFKHKEGTALRLIGGTTTISGGLFDGKEKTITTASDAILTLKGGYITARTQYAGKQGAAIGFNMSKTLNDLIADGYFATDMTTKTESGFRLTGPEVAIYAKPDAATFDKTEFTYNGKEQTPTVNVKDMDGNTLQYGTDYIVQYDNGRINAGKYEAKVVFIDRYENCAPITLTYQINKANYDMSNVKFENKSVTYNGKNQTIKATGLPEGVNVTYINNKKKKVGKYTATAVFTGDTANYNAIPNKTATFTIKPKGTSLKKLTAGKKLFKTTWKAQKTETTGYEVQYATDKKFTKSKKTVNIKKNKTTSTTVKKLKAKKKYYVRIRTYKTVNGKKYYSGWSKVLNVKTK